MIRRLSLSQRLALVFTSLLLLCALAVCLIQLYSSAQYGNVMVQRLSAGLAQQIAAREPLLDAQGQVDRRMLKPLFDRLMTFNTSVELYLLSPDGELLADAAPPGHIKRQRIDLAPVQTFLSGGAWPVYGDDPRSLDKQKVFSVAPLRQDGLLRGYLNDEGWEQACRYANACGALVVSRHGCAPAMPSKVELDDYLSRAAEVPRPDLDPHLNHLHRVTTRRRAWPELCVMAFDHRSQLEEMALQCGASLKRIPALKQLILQASREAANSAGLEGKAGLLCDGTFGQDALNAITGEGWWIGRPIELPGSRPLEMEHGNIGSQLISWPQEHVVKCLVFFHPEDAHALRLEQEQKIAEVYRACCQSGHELLLEVILPASMPRSDELYLRAISRFYNLGIYPDWWKLPPLTSAGWTALSDIIERRDPHCRGVVILGLDAPAEQLCADSKAAAGHGVVKGFAVGRTLFGDASRAWLKHDIDDAQLVARIKDNYLQLIAWWRERGQA